MTCVTRLTLSALIDSVLSSKTRKISIDTRGRAETCLIRIVHSRLTLGTCSAVSVLSRTSSIGVLTTRKTQRRALLRRKFARLAYITLSDIDGPSLCIEGARNAFGALGRTRVVLVASSRT